MSKHFGELDGPHPMLAREEQGPSFSEQAVSIGHRTTETFIKWGGAIAHNLAQIVQLTPDIHRHV